MNRATLHGAYASVYSGQDAAEKRGRFFVLFPGMAGVLVTARAVLMDSADGNPGQCEVLHLKIFTGEKVA
jgi:hypothetical protein